MMAPEKQYCQHKLVLRHQSQGCLGKYLSNFCRTIEMPSVNCEVSITVTSSANYIILSAAVANQAAVFAITDTKVYVPVVTLSRHDYAKLLQQLKSHFKRTID